MSGSTTSTYTPERRVQAQQLVNELKEERQEVWSLFFEIADLKPFDGNAEIKPRLKKFAEIMVDYVSLGHFGIYERILAGKERRDNILGKAQDMYDDFSNTTDIVVSFNDSYDDSTHGFSINNLEADLSKLGENLAKRMEIEDQLCSLLLR